MNNWYNGGGWYRPLEAPEAPETRSREEAAAPKPFYKRGVFYAMLCALLLLACVIFIIFVPSGGNSDSPDYDINGDMPKDFHDFMDVLYSSTTVTIAPVYLPAAEDRGSLVLSVAGANEGRSLSLQELYERCTPSVVSVKAKKESGGGYSWGSGIVASADGYIITNTHVIEECVSAEIGLTDGSTYEARLVGADSVSDIAVLKIDAQGLTPAVFAAADSVSVGDVAVAIGNPLGEAYRLTMTNGIISAKDRSVNYNGTAMNLLQTNAAINGGNSGGPLFNERGQVVGITNMKMISAISGIEGIGFAIPTDTVQSVVASIMRDGAVYGRSSIGIVVGAVPKNIAEYYDIPDGLYISSVEKNSDAAKQGVKPGDILVSVGGVEVHTTADVAAAKESYEIGDRISLVLWRDGKTVEADVLLMDLNEIYGNK
ncbi:MAG: trypsin-like peptidase domain-containing protein [Oscillospiraceae bacterium]|nr:trypsin-like peptidase domain-containing protein [Oscillospiraceae bacterium]